MKKEPEKRCPKCGRKMIDSFGRLMAWVCFEIVKEERQKLGKEIQKLATEPIWDKKQDIRYQDIKTRTPKELCQAIDDLVDFDLSPITSN